MLNLKLKMNNGFYNKLDLDLLNVVNKNYIDNVSESVLNVLDVNLFFMILGG